MKKKSMTKRLSIWAAIVAAILMIPFVTKAPWTGSDYVFAGTVLFGAASIYEFTTRKMTNPNHRIIVGITVITVLIFIWGLAVSGE